MAFPRDNSDLVSFLSYSKCCCSAGAVELPDWRSLYGSAALPREAHDQQSTGTLCLCPAGVRAPQSRPAQLPAQSLQFSERWRGIVSLGLIRLLPRAWLRFMEEKHTGSDHAQGRKTLYHSQLHIWCMILVSLASPQLSSRYLSTDSKINIKPERCQERLSFWSLSKQVLVDLVFLRLLSNGPQSFYFSEGHVCFLELFGLEATLNTQYWQGCLLLHQTAQTPFESTLKHFQGWGIHIIFGQRGCLFSTFEKKAVICPASEVSEPLQSVVSSSLHRPTMTTSTEHREQMYFPGSYPQVLSLAWIVLCIPLPTTLAHICCGVGG